MSKLIANTFRHTAASSDAITLDSSGNITFNGTVTGDNDTVYDDSSLRKDLATLALQTAVDTNRKAYNLNNSFIDQFEDDSGIGTETNVDRNTSEYIGTKVVSTTYVKPPFRKMSTGAQDPGPTTSSWTGGGVTNDSYGRGWAATNSWYPGTMVDYLWDLSNDFTVRLFSNDTSGDILAGQYFNVSVVVYPHTSPAAGASPTGVFASPPAKEPMGIRRSGGQSGWDEQIDDTYENNSNSNLGSLNTSALHNSVDHNTLSSPYNRSLDASNGIYAFHSYINSSNSSHAGIQFDYDKSAGTLVIKRMASDSRTTLDTTNVITVSNVPSAGRCIIAVGSGVDASAVWSSTYKDGSDSDYSSYVGETTSATGTLIGSANTASSSRTKVSGTFLYKNASGTATVGTDLKIYFTCNGGTNWTEAASYTAGSDFSTGI